MAGAVRFVSLVSTLIFGRMERPLAERQAHPAELERACRQLKTNFTLQECHIGSLLEEARTRLPEPFSQDQLQRIADEERHALDALYILFEDQFRTVAKRSKGGCAY